MAGLFELVAGVCVNKGKGPTLQGIGSCCFNGFEMETFIEEDSFSFRDVCYTLITR